MSAKDNPSDEKEPRVTASLLRRLVTALESNARSHRLEIAAAVLLGLATTASAWCAYQSNLWSGVQMFRLVATNDAARKSAQLTLAANQTQSVDVQLLFVYVEASIRGDKRLADFAYRRFRPEARKAMDAWLQTDPFNNPNAPVRFFRIGGIRSTRERGSQACR
jgi:hypothetical protein